MSQSAESLVEERVMQLQEISKRRNELLREMYHLLQKRDNLGSVIAVEEESEENLQLFLDRFDLEKHPETGLIENLQEEEVALPITPPAYSPVASHAAPQQSMSEKASVSPIPSPRPSPPAERVSMPAEAAPQTQEDVNMDVDETAADPSPSHTPQEAPQTQPSRTASREPSTTHEGKADARLSTDVLLEETEARDEAATRESPASRRDPPESASHAASSPDSPVPQSVDHSSTVSYTEAPVTREPSSSRVSPSRPQRSPSAPRLSRDPESTIKSEPLDDEPMDIAEGPLTVEEQPPKASESPRAYEISQQPSEDHIMEILGPSQAVSSPARDEEQHHASDYFIPVPKDEPIEDFSLNGEITAGLQDVDVTPVEPFGPEPPYPLPPLSLLPIEFSRRGKNSKRERKRDKEKEKGEGKKDEWAPMSLAKWAAVLRANPVHKKLSRANKCLSTRDWSVGMMEMRLIRTFERIEMLKDAGRWSFRQIKKQRGVGGLAKTHWDYLLDEMKWMRTDFREERRWKLALAYTLAHAVMEWHEARSLEERVRRGICVLWKPPPPEDTEMADVGEAEQTDGPFRSSQEGDDTGADSRETGTPLNDYGSDDESEDEQDKEQQDVINALEPGAALQDALEQLEQTAQDSQSQPGNQETVTLKPKLEEIEDLTALGDSPPREDNAMQVDSQKTETAEGEKAEGSQVAKLAAPEAESHPGLKPTSKNPVLGKAAVEGDAAHGKNKNKANQYAPLRDHIVYSQLDKLFLDLDDLDIIKGMSELSTDDFSPTAPPPPTDLTSIFPDLQPYGMLDVAPPAPTGPDGSRKKSDRRGDKDDPNKRAEDTTYSKLVPMSKFMQVKPTLVGTLQPAKHWKDGKWERIEETPVFADIDVPPARPIEENLCALFEGGKTSSTHTPVMPSPAGRKRNADIVWTPAEDALLRQIAEKYPNNWSLIAEAFNSSRVTISTDRRTPWDCWEHFKELTAEGRAAGEAESRPATPAAAAAAAHMTTRGYKRTANQSVAAAGGSSASSSGQASEPRKKVRHNLMHDTLRKAAKRREAVQKSNATPRAKPSAVHETHGQVTKMQRLTPAELSRMKAEKEARDAQELLMRRRNDELARQHILREQAQRAQGLPPNTPTPQAALLPPGAAVNGVPRPPGSVPPQTPMVQPIRSQVGISQQQQQQRLAVALANANTRMSPPQFTPAQAAHYRAMAAAAQGQGQAQASAAGQASGQAGGQVPSQIPQQSGASAALSAAAPALSATHLSPSFAARATSSSPGLPQQSPPLPAASPANAAVARPPSVPGQPVQGVPMNPMLHAQNVAHYYLQMQQRGITSEQLQAALMAQAQQQQRQAQQQAQQQQYAAHAQQQQQQQQQQAAQQGQNSQNQGYQHT
ncbi:hypothetical protein C8Q73DRAFT_252201 [Cubamyces lactineus]|nr:hypothetical protein C8Q73DRAFT_252201 [Cubamyces lactineus]